MQLERVNVYFAQGRHERYVPRAILIDLDRARQATYGGLFRPEWVIGGQRSASNNFAKGFLTEGDRRTATRTVSDGSSRRDAAA